MPYLLTQEIFQIILVVYSIFLIYNHSYLAHSDLLMTITTYWLMAHGVVHSLLLTEVLSFLDNGLWHHVLELLFVLICFMVFRGVDWLHAFKSEDQAFEWPIISFVLSIMFFVMSLSSTYSEVAPNIIAVLPAILTVLASALTLLYLIQLKLSYDQFKLGVLMDTRQFQSVSTLVNSMSDTYEAKLNSLLQTNAPEAHMTVLRNRLDQARIPVYSNQLELAAMLAKPTYKANLRPSWVTLNNAPSNPVLLTLFFELLIQILIAEDLNLQLRLADHPLIPACWTIDYKPSQKVYPLTPMRHQRIREEMLNQLKVELKLKLELSIEQDNHYYVTITHEF